MNKILIVEDEVKINNMLYDFLKFNNFEVIRAYDGLEGVNKFIENDDIQLVLLDIMLPILDGYTVLRKIRKQSKVPIIILSARSDIDDVLLGYELKVDDYITKPFNLDILHHKIMNLLKRINQDGNSNDDVNGVIEAMGIKIFKNKYQVFIESEEIFLEKKQFEILLYLMENSNIVISREKLLDVIWGFDFYGNVRVVDSQIKKLRQKLKDKGYVVKTVFGVGYKFDVD